VLGAEREIIANHVLNGEVRLVFWPILDLGPNSTNAAAAAFCAGEQDPATFWAFHDALFANQRDVYGADRAYFVDMAATAGLDGTAFATCYDGEAVRDLLDTLDDARRQLNVFQRPSFDLASATGTERLLGALPYDAFAEAFAAQMP